MGKQLYIDRKVSKRLDRPGLDVPDELIGETREIAAMLQGLVNSIDKKSRNLDSPESEESTEN